MKYKGLIKKVTHDKGNWARIIVELESGEEIVAIGKIIAPKDGYNIVMDAKEEVHPEWGKQLHVKNATMTPSKSKDGIIAYLTSGFIKGIGPVLANKIYDKFGDDTLKVIENEPEKLLEIDGISKGKMTSIVESHTQDNIYEDLYNLAKGKITTNQANKIINKYGENTINVIKENPYKLIYDIDGFGFKIVDQIALACGVPEISKQRIGAAIVFVLKTLSESEGHCFATDEPLMQEVINLINPIDPLCAGIRTYKKFIKELYTYFNTWEENGEEFLEKKSWKFTEEKKEEIRKWVEYSIQIVDVFADSIIDEVEADHLVLDEDEINGITRIYWKKLYDAECTTAEIVAKLVTQKAIKKFNVDDINNEIENIEVIEDVTLGDEQREAVRMGLKNRFSIITGGPGRGKTTIIKSILDIWNNDEKVILCAPTGKASQRMKESTGREASTIHRAILSKKINSDEDEIDEYNNPKDCLIIVDESSMLDISLASRLLRWATKYDNNIILVGDADQLSSVGPGNFFKDLIASKCVPTTFLRTCYRNSGSIAINAERINNGLGFKNLIRDEHFKFIESDKDVIQKVILDEYDKLRKDYAEKDIVVLSPSHTSSSGVDILNNLIREKYNPYDSKNPKLEETNFRLGDRIMQTKNNARKSVVKDGVYSEGVFNGDCGKITDIDLVNNQFEVTFDDDRIAKFDRSEMETFKFCYAMTIHKSQGSEYKAVIVINSTQHFIQLKRNLLYTAETRAKDKIILIGQAKAVGMAIRNTDYEERNSRLKIRIKNILIKL